MLSHEEIQRELEALKALRPRLRPRSAFGDDNLAALDAQIEVLEEDLTHDDIYDRWPDDTADLHVRTAAEEARQWLDGEYELDTLAEGWEGVTV